MQKVIRLTGTLLIMTRKGTGQLKVMHTLNLDYDDVGTKYDKIILSLHIQRHWNSYTMEEKHIF